MAGVRDRVIVVTGAGNGIGRGYARYLAREGAHVVVNDIGGDVHGVGADTRAADDVVKEIVDAGGSAVANYDSVADADSAKSIVETAIDSFGRIDGVINNAGILRDVTFHKMAEQQLTDVLRVHFYGSVFVTQAAWPHFRQQEYGKVLVTSSGAGLFGNFGQSAYSAAKMAVVGLIRTLAIEGARFNIRANAISPGGATRMTAGTLNDDESPNRRGNLDPDWVAPAAAFLMSDECTDTGTVIRAFGGRFMRIAFASSVGVTLTEMPDLESFAAVWPSVMDMDGADFSERL